MKFLDSHGGLFAARCRQRRTASRKIFDIYQQRDLPGKLTHDHARFGNCGFSLGFSFNAPAFGTRLSDFDSHIPDDSCDVPADGHRVPAANGFCIPVDGSCAPHVSSNGSRVPADGSHVAVNGPRVAVNGSHLPVDSFVSLQMVLVFLRMVLTTLLKSQLILMPLIFPPIKATSPVWIILTMKVMQVTAKENLVQPGIQSLRVEQTIAAWILLRCLGWRTHYCLK